MNEVFAVAQVGLHGFLSPILCTLWVGSGVLQIFSLKATLWSAYWLGVALMSEFLCEKLNLRKGRSLE